MHEYRDKSLSHDFESSEDESMRLQLSEDEDVHDSDSDEEIAFGRRQKSPLRVYRGDIERRNSSNFTSFPSQCGQWSNVTNNDTYSFNMSFSTGGKITGPIVQSTCSSPIHFFQLFFTDSLITKIVSETNAYASNTILGRELSSRSIWKEWKDVTECEMKAFLGVIINMGLIEMPSIYDYWSTKLHSKLPFFSQIFSRKRFMQIFWALHVDAVQTRNMDIVVRTRRINTYLEFLNNKFMEHFIPEENLSIDESTVGFKGRASFLSYNPKKPRKWGIRIYMLADSRTSYCYTFVPYYGKITTDSLIRPDLSFTSRIVLHLYNNLQNSIPGASGYHIFTDRFYTNPILATELLKEKCFLTGTIMTNKKGIPDVIRKPKLAIGQTIAYRNGKALVLAWRHKRVITMLSTKHTSAMLTRTRRKRRRAMSEASNSADQDVKKPSVIFDYNDNMGGVDVADQYAVSYGFIRKTLKWWRKLFFWGFETSIINSFILYKERARINNEKPMDHKTFRQNLLMELIGHFREPKPPLRRLTSGDREQRLDKTPHFIFQLPNRRAKDCLVCSKRNIPGGRKETSYFCDTCERKPGLHPGDCFKRYHTLDNYKI